MPDTTDHKIIEALKEDGRSTVREVSKKIREPITTVHNRLNKLRKEGVIKKFTIVPDYEKLGKPISAFVFLNINHDKLDKEGIEGMKKQLRSFPEVDKLFAVTGDVDFIVSIRIASIKELDTFLLRKLRSLKAIQKTVTQIVLEEN